MNNENENLNENDLVMAEIEKRNPYIRYDQSTGTVSSNLENGRHLVTIQTSSNETLYLNRDIIERAIYLQRFACNVKLFILLDLIMNFIYIYVGYYFTLTFILCSIGGYISTINYNRNFLLLYLFYQYFQLIAKLAILITLMVLVIDPSLQNDFNNTFPEIVLPNNYTNTILLTSAVVLIQAYITFFIHRFYRLLPTNEIRRRLLSRYSNN